MSKGRRPSSILILGGGTAGWMAANLFQHHWGPLGTRVALIESQRDRDHRRGRGLDAPAQGLLRHDRHLRAANGCRAATRPTKRGIEFDRLVRPAGLRALFPPVPRRFRPAQPPASSSTTRRRAAPARDVCGAPRSLLPRHRASRTSAGRRWPPRTPIPVELRLSFRRGAARPLFCKEVATARGVEHVDAKIAEVELGAERRHRRPLRPRTGAASKPISSSTRSGFRAA